MRIGLGVYPDSPCFDRDRPSWQPYWFDTFSEEACRAERFVGINTTLNFRDPAPGYSPAVPDTALTSPYYITQQDILDAQQAKAREWAKTAIPDLPDTPKANWHWLVLAGAASLFLLRKE